MWDFFNNKEYSYSIKTLGRLFWWGNRQKNLRILLEQISFTLTYTNSKHYFHERENFFVNFYVFIKCKSWGSLGLIYKNNVKFWWLLICWIHCSWPHFIIIPILCHWFYVHYRCFEIHEHAMPIKNSIIMTVFLIKIGSITLGIF